MRGAVAFQRAGGRCEPVQNSRCSLVSEQSSRITVRSYGCPVIMAGDLIGSRERPSTEGNQGGTAIIRP